MRIYSKHSLYRLVIIVLSVYLVVGATLFFKQTSYIYFPDNTDFSTCPYFKHTEKIVQNGTRMYYKNNGEKLAVLYHGNAGSACDRGYYASLFQLHNISYLIVEYAGYSGDTKRPSRDLIYKDVENVIEKLKELDYSELIVVGESLGVGALSYHTTLQTPDKLILISSFTRLSDVAKIHYPWYPVKWLLREEYDNITSLSQYEGKFLAIHGEADTIIPISLSRELFDNVPSQDKHFVTIPNVGHNNLLISNLFSKSILDFIQ